MISISRTRFKKWQSSLVEGNVSGRFRTLRWTYVGKFTDNDSKRKHMIFEYSVSNGINTKIWWLGDYNNNTPKFLIEEFLNNVAETYKINSDERMNWYFDNTRGNR